MVVILSILVLNQKEKKECSGQEVKENVIGVIGVNSTCVSLPDQ